MPMTGVWRGTARTATTYCIGSCRRDISPSPGCFSRECRTRSSSGALSALIAPRVSRLVGLLFQRAHVP